MGTTRNGQKYLRDPVYRKLLYAMKKRRSTYREQITGFEKETKPVEGR